MANSVHAAAKHMPFFITAPGQTDVLMVIMAVVLVASVLGIGVFYWWLHSLPERMVHHKLQFDIVALLCLLSLFTHNHAFWIAAILLAFIKFPDPTSVDAISPLRSMARSLKRISEPPTASANESPDLAETVEISHAAPHVKNAPATKV